MARSCSRMSKHSLGLLCFVVLLECVVYIDGSLITRYNDTDPVFRHRRSYERHKSKDSTSAVGNTVKAGNSNKQSPFATDNCTIVYAQIGGTATLPCVVRKSNIGVVTWIRKSDYHILTIGLVTYNTDDRYLVEHVRHLQNWGLLIKKVLPSDAGHYECQVSTHPPSSILIELRVTKALAEIQGSPELYIHSGSLLRLVCNFRNFTEQPEFVFWYHEHRMINYDPGVTVKKARGQSVLQLDEADKSHNGNYTCNPSNVAPASIIVHVLNATAEEKPAAMQHANSSSSSPLFYLTNCGVILVMVFPWMLTT